MAFKVLLKKQASTNRGKMKDRVQQQTYKKIFLAYARIYIYIYITKQSIHIYKTVKEFTIKSKMALK